MNDNKKQLLSLLRCDKCSSEKPLYCNTPMLTCGCGNRISIKDGIVEYATDEALQHMPEVEARDEDAENYLLHAKFPIQTYRVKKFIDNLPTCYLSRRMLITGKNKCDISPPKKCS